MDKELLSNPSGYIYLASPYSSLEPATVEARYKMALKMAAKLTAQGYTVFSPIVHSHPMSEFEKLPATWEFWQEFDRAFIAAASQLWVLCLPGWADSVGVAAELKIAMQYDLPVYYVTPDTISPAGFRFVRVTEALTFN